MRLTVAVLLASVLSLAVPASSGAWVKQTRCSHDDIAESWTVDPRRVGCSLTLGPQSRSESHYREAGCGDLRYLEFSNEFGRVITTPTGSDHGWRLYRRGSIKVRARVRDGVLSIINDGRAKVEAFFTVLCT